MVVLSLVFSSRLNAPRTSMDFMWLTLTKIGEGSSPSSCVEWDMHGEGKDSGRQKKQHMTRQIPGIILDRNYGMGSWRWPSLALFEHATSRRPLLSAFHEKSRKGNSTETFFQRRFSKWTSIIELDLKPFWACFRSVLRLLYLNMNNLTGDLAKCILMNLAYLLEESP